MASDQIFVATETFTATVDGVPVVVHRDQTRVRAGHPLLKGREAFFKPLTVHYDIEQATAAPGEQRGAPPAPPAPVAPAPAPAPVAAPAATAPAKVPAGITTASIKPVVK